jgi:hypothetical protein
LQFAVSSIVYSPVIDRENEVIECLAYCLFDRYHEFGFRTVYNDSFLTIRHNEAWLAHVRLSLILIMLGIGFDP